MPQTPASSEFTHTQSGVSCANRGGQQVIDLVTCEYPPALGGVADYSLSVTQELEQRGYVIRVWAPSGKESRTLTPDGNVMWSMGRFGVRDIAVNERLMGSARNRCLLLQWEPVGFGMQSINLPFCLWMATRTFRGTRLVVMFHETFLPFNKRSLKRYFAGTVQRLMASVLVNCASAVFVSNGSGVRALKRLCFRPEKIVHLPVFSNITSGTASGKEKDDQTSEVRKQFARPDESLVGHFGRFMANTEPLVLPALYELLRREPKTKVLFIGECGPRSLAALLAKDPGLSTRVFSSGVGTSEEISGLISACDLMFQPYPGGITTKRGSTMAALVNGRYIVSNRGPETESLWNECGGVRLLETLEPAEVAAELSRLTPARAELAQRGAAGSAYYQSHFSLEHTVDAVLSTIGWPEIGRA